MHGKPVGTTKIQLAIDYLRNNLELLSREPKDLPLTIASRATWQNALAYMHANPQLHCKPRVKSKYYSRARLTKGKIIGVVTNWEKLDRAVAAYRLAGFYEEERKETVA